MSEGNPAHQLRIIFDDKGHSMAKRMYETYIKQAGTDQEGTYDRFAEFLIALDRLLGEFGAHPAPPENEGEAGEDGEKETQDEDDDEPYGDDEDIHAEASVVDNVKMAIAKVLELDLPKPPKKAPPPVAPNVNRTA